METGHGARHTAGPGWDRSHGVGRLITTVDGSITTTIGPGVRASAINAVGGDRRWWLFSRSTSTLVQRSAGIRFLTINAIRAPVTTSDTIETIEIRDVAETTMTIGDDIIQPTGAQSLVFAKGISAGKVRGHIQPNREWHDARSMQTQYRAIYRQDVRSGRMIRVRDQTELGEGVKLHVVAGCRRCLIVPRAPRSALPASHWMANFGAHAFSMDVIPDPTLQGFRLVPAALTRYPRGRWSDLCDASANRMARILAIVASIGMPILARVRYDRIGLIRAHQ